MKNKKVLYFEGAGISSKNYQTGTKELPNCRIRTVFKNLDGEIYYLELSATEVTKYIKKMGGWALNAQIGNHIAFVNHLFEINNINERADENKTGLTNLWSQNVSYKKEILLNFINNNLNCDYNDIIILNNTDYRVFADKGYNLMNDYIFDLEIEKQHQKVYDYFEEFEKNVLKKQYSNFSYMRDIKNKKSVEVLIHYNCYNHFYKIEDVTKYQFDYKKPEPQVLRKARETHNIFSDKEVI